MAAKDVSFSQDARDRMLRGVDILAEAVKCPWSGALGQIEVFAKGGSGSIGV